MNFTGCPWFWLAVAAVLASDSDPAGAAKLAQRARASLPRRVVLVGDSLAVGLARPLLNPGNPLVGKGPLLLVVDDGWAAARNWPARQRALDILLDHAEQEERKVALVTTAPRLGFTPAEAQPFVDAAAIRQRIKAMVPEPWPVDRGAALERPAVLLSRHPPGQPALSLG